MSNKIGIWIDHRKAVIVNLSNGEHNVQIIPSNIEKRVRAAGGSRTGNTPWGPQDIVAEDQIFRKYLHHLDSYYDKLIDIIKDSDAIFIFGPGRAKIELVKKINKSKALIKKLVNTETTDKLTDRQIVAKVKKFFQD